LLSKLVYLELTDNYLLLSKIKKQRNRFFLNSPQEISLKNLEFKNGILYNLSSTFLNIKNFLKTNKLNNPKTIVCIPSIQNEPVLKQNLSVLQIALCLCKSGLKIEKMIGVSLLKKEDQMQNYFDKNDLEKQLDFFKPFTQEKHTKPIRWTIIFGVAYFLLITTIYITQKNKILELKTLQVLNSELLATNNILETKVALLHESKKNVANLTQKIEKIKNIYQKTNKFKNILIGISDVVPQDCILSKVRIEPLKDKKPTQTLIKLEGSTDNQQQISLFLQKLAQKPLLTNLKIAKIQKIKDQKLHFFFQITGFIKKSA
jgi:Tfp pilus assembly protein PilN